jgi:hypothetical protein
MSPHSRTAHFACLVSTHMKAHSRVGAPATRVEATHVSGGLSVSTPSWRWIGTVLTPPMKAHTESRSNTKKAVCLCNDAKEKTQKSKAVHWAVHHVVTSETSANLLWQSNELANGSM